VRGWLQRNIHKIHFVKFIKSRKVAYKQVCATFLLFMSPCGAFVYVSLAERKDFELSYNRLIINLSKCRKSLCHRICPSGFAVFCSAFHNENKGTKIFNSGNISPIFIRYLSVRSGPLGYYAKPAITYF
jgi:hypothetical protein